MAIPHTVVTGAIKPAAQGWILFHGMRSHYWHWLTTKWTTPCQSTRIVKPTDIMEWRPEPRGRWEVCPDCRRHLQREEQRAKAAASQAISLPELRPETVEHDDQSRAEDEPEVITASHIAFPTPAASPPTPKAPTVSNGQPTPTVKPPADSDFLPTNVFAKREGLSYGAVLAFVKEKLPNTPRYAKSYLLDRVAQAFILKHFAAWHEARLAAVKAERLKRWERIKELSPNSRKHAAAAVQAKALSTFQSVHTTPAGNVERVMAAIAEVKELVLMLAEDVAKLQADAAKRAPVAQDGDA